MSPPPSHSRLKLQGKFKKEVSAMATFFDNALCAAHANARKSALKPQVFVQIYDDIIERVLDKGCLERILNEKGSWKSVHSELNAVVGSSQLGARLFGFALDHVLAEVVGDAIETRLDMLFAGSETITKDKIDEAKRDVAAAIAAMENIDGLPMRRQLGLVYRGFEVPLKISSTGEEIEMRTVARVKALAAWTRSSAKTSCSSARRWWGGVSRRMCSRV